MKKFAFVLLGLLFAAVVYVDVNRDKFGPWLYTMGIELPRPNLRPTSSLASTPIVAQNAEALALAEKYIHRPTNGNPFVSSNDPFDNFPILREAPYYAEFNGLRTQEQNVEINVADKLNGISDRVEVSFVCDAYRLGKTVRGQSSVQWSEWQAGGPDNLMLKMTFERKNGVWSSRHWCKWLGSWNEAFSITAKKEDKRTGP